MHPIYTGAAEHHLKDGSVRRFKPSGPMYLVPGNDRARTKRRLAAEAVSPLPIGLSARLFVGLSVGQKQTYKIDDIVSATKEFRTLQGVPIDSSFIAQKGLYTQDGVPVEENSVQIVIIDMQGLSMKDFTTEILDLAEYLRAKFDQKEIIVELQEAGIAQKVLSVTAGAGRKTS